MPQCLHNWCTEDADLQCKYLCMRHQYDNLGGTRRCESCDKRFCLVSWDRCLKCAKDYLLEIYRRIGSDKEIDEKLAQLKLYQELGTVEELIDMQCQLDIYKHSSELELPDSN